MSETGTEKDSPQLNEETREEEPAPGVTEPADDAQAALEEARAKADENWNQYLRAMAELENTRKRAQRDIEQTQRFALERFAGELLPVKDSLEMGLNAASDASDQTDALIEGTTMTLKLLGQVFEKFGIVEVNPEGEAFNPEHHEAMATQPSSEAEPGTVLTVVQKGYLLNGRVLRPARVLVARKPDDDAGGSA